MSTFDFTDLYHLHYKKLFHLSYSIIRDRQLAEDVVQETFIKAMQHVKSIEEENKIGAWLSVIATRTAIDFIRKERKKQGIPMDQEMLEFLGKEMKQNVEEEVEVAVFIDQVKSIIKNLTVDYQDVLSLRLWKGLKEQEIARILDLKPCTVKTRIYRARKQLKVLFLERMSA
ncbi:RNA polymerase sigma factor [Aquibacillus saliphilus]|uniref:RNA polymerase sigma factor n=1 Tax=Aquibacillus saliphilus TaxID=1909422 RepID=UPI001CF074ED